jgi:hypothetical protein
MKAHMHAEFIKAWADGVAIQYFDNGVWRDKLGTSWADSTIYRIKPDQQKTTLYIYNNNELHKTFMSHRPPTDNTVHDVYCEYMGKIEVFK